MRTARTGQLVRQVLLARQAPEATRAPREASGRRETPEVRDRTAPLEQLVNKVLGEMLDGREPLVRADLTDSKEVLALQERRGRRDQEGAMVALGQLE